MVGREQSRLLELSGKVDWDADYDYKADRSRFRGPRRGSFGG